MKDEEGSIIFILKTLFRKITKQKSNKISIEMPKCQPDTLSLSQPWPCKKRPLFSLYINKVHYHLLYPINYNNIISLFTLSKVSAFFCLSPKEKQQPQTLLQTLSLYLWKKIGISMRWLEVAPPLQPPHLHPLFPLPLFFRCNLNILVATLLFLVVNKNLKFCHFLVLHTLLKLEAPLKSCMNFASLSFQDHHSLFLCKLLLCFLHYLIPLLHPN